MTLVVSAVAAGASALTVSVNPGGLRAAVADPASVTELTVSGSVDMTDFEFITMEMTALRTLDLGGATVAAYSGEPGVTGRTSSAAGELPEGALMVASLESVTLPASLTAIGSGAFGSSSLRAITLPESLKSIGTGAFAECRSLREVTVPASVTSLGQKVFAGCVSLETVTVGGPVGEVPAGAFRGCSALRSVSLPASVGAIGEDAFAGCASLETLAFPAGLRTIGSRAFFGSGLRSADLAACAKLEGVGNWAFACSAALESVTFPQSMTHMGTGAFFNDASMLLDAAPQGVAEIADYSLRGVGGAPEVTLPEGVTSIGRHALANWTGVQTLTLPSTLESVDDGAMANWSALREIDAQKAVAVPRLGAGVWEGVDQPVVTLRVSNDLREEFENAPQWQEFKIEAMQNPTGVPAVDEAAEGAVSARFEGLTLHISAPAEIAGVQLYDLQGRRFAFPVSADSATQASVDTSAWDSAVMIVRVVLSDGTAATMKLSR